jgi:hypothetical protein
VLTFEVSGPLHFLGSEWVDSISPCIYVIDDTSVYDGAQGAVSRRVAFHLPYHVTTVWYDAPMRLVLGSEFYSQCSRIGLLVFKLPETPAVLPGNFKTQFGAPPEDYLERTSEKSGHFSKRYIQ